MSVSSKLAVVQRMVACFHLCAAASLSSNCSPHPIPPLASLQSLLSPLSSQAEKSDRTALQAVIDHIRNEMDRLNALEEEIMTEFGPEDERLQDIYTRLEELDPSTFEARIEEAKAQAADTRVAPLLCRAPVMLLSFALLGALAFPLEP